MFVPSDSLPEPDGLTGEQAKALIPEFIITVNDQQDVIEGLQLELEKAYMELTSLRVEVHKIIQHLSEVIYDAESTNEPRD